MRTTLCGLLVALVALVTPQEAFAGKVSGKTKDLEGGALAGVRIQAFAVSVNGVVDQTPFKTVFSKNDGSYEIDLGNAPRVILRYFRADRNDTLLPTPPTSITGGAISGEKDIANLDVLVPERQPGAENEAPSQCYEPCYLPCYLPCYAPQHCNMCYCQSFRR